MVLFSVVGALAVEGAALDILRSVEGAEIPDFTHP